MISGGALGIDAAAHRGALQGKGATFAVFGCGIDVVYPDRHRRLFDEVIAGGGGLLSEYSPGTPPRPWQFPARNRIVAALAQMVIVGESRTGSGALITARLAATPGTAVAGDSGQCRHGWPAGDRRGVARAERRRRHGCRPQRRPNTGERRGAGA